MKAGIQENSSAAKICITNVHNSPEFVLLKNYIPINALDPTLKQMSDRTFATPAQIQAIFATHSQARACRQALLNGLAQIVPSVVPILVASYNKNEDDLLALTERKMTWGDYTRRERDRATETQFDLQAEDSHIVSGLQQQHRAEIEQRQRSADALPAWAQTQELINAANRPVITNCNALGSMVNCVTHEQTGRWLLRSSFQ